jgi:hypothetical protein
MNPSAWVALAIGAVGLMLNTATLLIGYGATRGAVRALEGRVATLEAELNALAELKVTVAEVKTTIGFVLEQIKDLNASIRWLRQPAEYNGPEASGAIGSVRRK